MLLLAMIKMQRGQDQLLAKVWADSQRRDRSSHKQGCCISQLDHAQVIPRWYVLLYLYACEWHANSRDL